MAFRNSSLKVFMVLLVALMLVSCAQPAPAPVLPTAAPAVEAPATAAPAAEAPATEAPAAAPSKYQEAPMLADLVKAGTLPPVDQRLPKDPMVLTPIEEVGTYGGQMAWINPGPDLGSYEFQFLYEAPYRWSADATKVEPNLAISHEYAPDGMSMTLKFREGVKWSDGEEFTSEDLDFWWNDLVMNTEAGYQQPYWTITAEKPMKLEVVDKYTIKVSFNAPHWLFHRLMASTADYMWMYAPKHYLKQFHPKYNPDVKDFAELNKRFPPTGNMYTNDLNLPVLTPWKTVEFVPSQRLVAERNPYYWKVDSAGNQLPYIDKIVINQVEDPRVIPLKIVGGEVDFMARNIPLDAFTTLKTSETEGNYRVIQWKVGAGADPALVPNWDNQNEEMRKIIRDRNFRLGLSYAIDRKTVNDVVYFGLGAPSQAVTSPYSPWGRTTEEGKQLMEQWRNLAVEYDVAKANEYLDKVLPNKDAEGFRLMPDGKRFTWIFITGSSPDSRAVDVLEFVVEFWKAVGIETKINSMDWAAFWPLFSNGEYDIAGWDAWTGYDIPTIPDTLFPIGSAYWGTPLTAMWFNTQGQKGIKPDPGDPMDRMIGFYNKMLAETTDEGQNKWVLEAVKVHVAEGPFFLGVVNDIPNLVVARPNLRNIPDFAFTGSWAQGAPGCTNPPTYFYKK
jgi:peptide/nickel transport system substrate-binding protein